MERDGCVVGRTGQRRIDVPHDYLPAVAPERLLNTYYRFAPPMWGTGITFEAARAAVDATLGNGVLHPIVAITTPDNVPSQSLALRPGMRSYRRVPLPGLLDTVELRPSPDHRKSPASWDFAALGRTERRLGAAAGPKRRP